MYVLDTGKENILADAVTDAVTDALCTAAQQHEKTKAFDLLDAISR